MILSDAMWLETENYFEDQGGEQNIVCAEIGADRLTSNPEPSVRKASVASVQLPQRSLFAMAISKDLWHNHSTLFGKRTRGCY